MVEHYKPNAIPSRWTHSDSNTKAPLFSSNTVSSTLGVPNGFRKNNINRFATQTIGHSTEITITLRPMRDRVKTQYCLDGYCLEITHTTICVELTVFSHKKP